MTELRKKLQGWRIADLSVIAIFESAHQLGLLDALELTAEQHLHALELLMVAWLLGKAAWDKHKAAQE